MNKYRNTGLIFVVASVVIIVIGIIGVSKAYNNYVQFGKYEPVPEKVTQVTPKSAAQFNLDDAYLWDVSVLKKSRVDRISIYMYVADHRTKKPAWSSIISYKDIYGSSQQFNTHDQKSLKDTITDINIFINDIIPQLLKYTK